MYVGRLMCEESFAINPPLLLEYCEAIKIEMLPVLSWKPALEITRYVKVQIFLFLKARSIEVKRLTNCGEKFDKFI